MDSLKRSYRNGLYSFKGLYGFLKPEIYVLVKVINPIFQVLFFSLVAKHAYGNIDITPFVIGNAFVLCMYNAFFGVGVNLISERSVGTLKILIASPANKFKLFVSKSTFHILDGMITVFIGLLTGIVFLNLRIPLHTIPYFLISLIAAIFTACSMGLFIGSIGLVTRDINLLLNLSSMLLMSLSGVNFPTEKLPFFLERISHILPLTNALKASRLLISPAIVSYEAVGMYIFKELVIGVSYCIIAYITLKIMEGLAKNKATLDIY
ncbi:ABC transporter permease [Proteiniborus sp. MB09-C3]|uniref:ABC transporter permease n=1 Tax=Proteiniborus sp. MB09-C3 TaxID=3050072 RepID=UPI002554C01C|nr:ABC transporter permease [Proteiniborus sp. MB09-C3]WIV12465.1 ABC transporter permease [Proteiniborus sp. MB09-C3]